MLVAPVSSVDSANGSQSAPSQPPAALGGSQDPATVSVSGALLSRLQLLGQQDPAKLATIANNASQQLRTAAAAATGQTARSLNQLADGFARAASTGDVSSLNISGTARGRHHPRSAVTSSYTSSFSSLTQGAAAQLAAVSLQIDEALGLNPPPLGPWGNQ